MFHRPTERRGGFILIRSEKSVLENLPQEIKDAALGLVGLIPTATLARVLWHHRLVRIGERRRFWSWDLVTELPMAVFCAIIGGGIANYYQLDFMTSNAMVGAASWLGPRGIEVVLARFVNRYAPKPRKNANSKKEYD